MPDSEQRSGQLKGPERLAFLKEASVRAGLFTGVCLSAAFTGWVVAANRMPVLEPLALARNIAAVCLLTLIASLPAFRFFRSPGELLSSGLIAWSLLTLTFGVLRIFFVRLDASYSGFHVFVLGAVAYLLLATLSWVGTILWRAWLSGNSHFHH